MPEIDIKIKVNADEIRAAEREIDTFRTKLNSPTNPLNPTPSQRLSELGISTSPPGRSLIPQGPVNPLETSFAQVTQRASELSPKIIAAREEANKLAGAVQAVGGAFGIPNEALAKMTGLITTNSVATTNLVSSLAAVGPALAIGAAGAAVVYHITSDIREEAERRLKVEERITAVFNEQNKIRKEALDQYENSLEKQKQQFELNDRNRLNEQLSNKLLEDRLVLLDKMVRFNPSGENSERFQKEILEINQLLKQRSEPPTGPSVFDQSFAIRIKAQEEEAKRAAASVEAGKKLVEDYGKSVAELTQRLSAQRGQNNPFVAVFSAAEDAIKRTQEATRGLTKDLQQTLLTQQQALNDRALFAQRIGSGLEAIGLHEDAESFRGDRDRLAKFFSPEFLRARGLDGSAQARLQKQLDFLNRASFTPEQQEETDRQIIRLTSGIDPKSLTTDQREQAAAARERQEIRIQNQEKEAREDAKKDLQLREQTARDIQRLRELAEQRGKEGLEVILKDETDGRTSTELRNPTQADTDRAYGFGGFEFLGGTNR